MRKSPSKKLHYIEYFAGQANLTRMAKAAGHMAMATDLQFSPHWKFLKSNPLNMCSEAGFALLGPMCELCLVLKWGGNLLELYGPMKRCDYRSKTPYYT